MKRVECDLLVIGGGAAGMCAGLRAAAEGLRVIIAERDQQLGGILNQCIHNGFGLHYFKEELTGPEFAGKLEQRTRSEENIDVYLSLTIMDLGRDEGGVYALGISPVTGICDFRPKAVILAMGSRERNRGSIPISGTRPSGILTAGLAQRLINIEGILPGKRVVIAGSGDIGLIMARRLVWSGLEVLGVVEIQPYPAGLTRNIVQCLQDFSIPLYLNHEISRVYGRDRVTGVEVTPVSGYQDGKGSSFFLSCDTLLLSVGLIPENELTRKAAIPLHSVTGGAAVDSRYMTEVEGIFSCGNVLHVHDLVDYCAVEAEECAEGVIQYLEMGKTESTIPVVSGKNVRYAVPQSITRDRDITLSLRSLIVKNDCTLTVVCDEEIIAKKKLPHVQPSEMIRIALKSGKLSALGPDTPLEVILE